MRSTTSPASTAPTTTRGSTATRPRSTSRASIIPTPPRSTPCASGPARPTTGTTRSGLPIPPIPQRRRAADLHQQGAGDPHRVQLMPFNARFAEVTTALGFQVGHQELSAPSPDNPGTLFQWAVGPQQQHARCGLRLQRVQVHRANEGADRRPHRACRAARHDAELPGGLSARRHAAGGHRTQSVVHSRKAAASACCRICRAAWSAASPRKYVERAPKAAELFSRGGHDATADLRLSAIPTSPSRPPSRSSSACAGRRGRSGSRRPSTTRISTTHLSPAHRRDVR